MAWPSEITTVVFILILEFCSPHNILVMHPPSTGSHVKTIFGITKEMVRRGHHVTTIRYEMIQGIKLPYLENHTEIVLYINNTDGSVPFVTKEEKGMFIVEEMMPWNTSLQLWKNIPHWHANPWSYWIGVCEHFYANKSVIDWIRSQHFDVAVVDLIQNECMHALPVSMGIPIVGFWMTAPLGFIMEQSMQPSMPSYIPMYMTALSDRMNFFQRIQNFIVKFFTKAVGDYHIKVYVDPLIQRHLPGSPPYHDVIANLSGCLINSHSIYEVPMPRIPTFINILGSMIPKIARPLPKDISEFMEGAEHGVILLTMGMTYFPSDIPPHLEAELIKAFSRVKQRVLIKLHKIPPNLPKNVMVRTFLPQQSILAHPKTVLFFTHVGNNGLLEAINYRVPMVGMPIYMNQEDNLDRLVEKGVAVGVSKFSESEEIYEGIMKVISNNSYSDNINKMADLLALERHDPMDNAIWLLEYVAETRGAEHLKPASRHLNTMQYLSLDVIGFMALVAYIVTKFVRKLRHGKQQRREHCNGGEKVKGE